MRKFARALKWTALALVLGLVGLQLWYLGWVLAYRWIDPGDTAFMRRELAVLRESNPKAQIKHQWVPYERISPHLKRAVIAAEDARFNEHEGVDWDALGKAYETNLKRGKPAKGGSTITQQLAKNLFLSPDKSYLRKVQELIITYMIEALWDKRRILEVYLNSVEWGNGVFGAEAAARYYFGVPASALNREQAARLAAMLPRPKFYDRNRGSAFLAQRTQAVLRYIDHPEIP
ncbi:MAG: monofunctional biosynthetic peptidoglycan transglycosylase [Betaproteobacteria bacterium]